MTEDERKAMQIALSIYGAEIRARMDNKVPSGILVGEELYNLLSKLSEKCGPDGKPKGYISPSLPLEQDPRLHPWEYRFTDKDCTCYPRMEVPYE